MGAALELLPRFSYSRATVRYGTYGTVFVFVAANVFLVKQPINLIVSDFILGALFSLCCYFFLQATEKAARSLYLICSSVLAGMSYTLYLVHTPMLVFISAVFVGSWERWPFDFLHVFQFGIICLVTFAGAYGLYMCFERNTEGVRAWAGGLWALVLSSEAFESTLCCRQQRYLRKLGASHVGRTPCVARDADVVARSKLIRCRRIDRRSVTMAAAIPGAYLIFSYSE